MSPNEISDKTILFSALDWGMGHTTRSAALIAELFKQGNRIVFAGNEAQIAFMRREFPQIVVVPIKGYEVSLDSQKNTYVQMLRQSVKIRRAIRAELLRVEQLVDELEPDMIISDNRYGFRDDRIPSILLTHQINLQLPVFSKTTSSVLRRHVNRFDFCWIPDNREHPICGALTQGNLRIPIVFIGRLCRFKKRDAAQKFDRIAIISGPEPERTKFAATMNVWIKTRIGASAIVGCDGESCEGLSYFPNPSTLELEELIASSGIVISRAGYTTIMEMISLEKPAVLIPTAGQYEQEYLANAVKNPLLRFVDLEELKWEEV